MSNNVPREAVLNAEVLCPNCRMPTYLVSGIIYQCVSIDNPCYGMRFELRGKYVHILPADMHIFFKASQQEAKP